MAGRKDQPPPSHLRIFSPDEESELPPPQHRDYVKDPYWVGESYHIINWKDMLAHATTDEKIQIRHRLCADLCASLQPLMKKWNTDNADIVTAASIFGRLCTRELGTEGELDRRLSRLTELLQAEAAGMVHIDWSYSRTCFSDTPPVECAAHIIQEMSELFQKLAASSAIADIVKQPKLFTGLIDQLTMDMNDMLPPSASRHNNDTARPCHRSRLDNRTHGLKIYQPPH